MPPSGIAVFKNHRKASHLLAFPIREMLCFGDSGALVYRQLETHFLTLFHTAIPLQPPPLRGTSFHRKEGASTRAPSLGRGCRAQRGGVGFLLGRRSRLLFAFPMGESFISGIAVFSFRSLPHWGRGTASAVDRVLSYIVDLRRISSLFFIPLSPSYLRPFGTPPSIGRREYPREPLPLEGAAERSEAGLASFFAAKPPPLCLSHAGKALFRG